MQVTPSPPSATALANSDVRLNNLTLILQRLALNGSLARSEIALHTGLSRATVTTLVATLLVEGIIREEEPLPGQGRGRPLTRVRLAADSIAIAVAQIDADSVACVISDLAGNILLRIARTHGRPMADPAAILDRLGEAVGEAIAAAEESGRHIVDVTVVAFAPVGGEPRVVLADTDLGWGAVDVLGGLRERLHERPSVTFSIVGDGPVAALAERAHLVAEGHHLEPVSHLLYLKSDSGIGGASIINSSLNEGARGLAGSFGHLPLDRDGARCECGQTGCLVTVAGPDVLLTEAGLGPLLRDAGLAVALTTFVSRIRTGDAVATAVWCRAVDWIARSILILSLTTDPQVVVLGGYWRHLVPSIATAVDRMRPTILDQTVGGGIRIVPGKLGDDAAMLGALQLARDRLLADPARLGLSALAASR